MKNCLTSLRLDKDSVETLNDLASDLNFTKSQVMRQSIRLMKELKELKKQYGEIRLSVGNREIFVLIG